MSTDFFIPADEGHIKREKAKAREIRGTAWWKRKLSAGMCYYCGGKYRQDDLTMDHIVPLVRGGKSVRANMVPACKDCNNKKKYLLPMEWEEYLKSMHKTWP